MTTHLAGERSPGGASRASDGASDMGCRSVAPECAHRTQADVAGRRRPIDGSALGRLPEGPCQDAHVRCHVTDRSR